MALQHLKLHPLTGNSDHDTTGLVNGQIVYVQNPTNGVQSTGMYADGAGGLTATTASITTLSAGTMISGSTNLYDIFLTAGDLSGTTVSAGSNVSVVNLGNDYAVSVVANPSFNNITASGATSLQTLSATTMISGSTNLYQIFDPLGSGVQSVVAGSNITVGGTATNPIVNLAASPSFNGLTVSGTGNFTGILQSGGTNLYDIFTEGVGTANVLPLWSNNTGLLTNSIITQSGTGVTVAGSVNILGDVNVLGTATTFNTQTVQSQDNNILLNFSGSYVSALGGGITVLSGTPSGVASTWTIDANGAWSANTAILTSAITVNGGNIAVTGGGAMTSGGTNLYNIFATAGSGVQSVGANGNLSTGGTATNPTIILAASPSFNNVSYSGTSTGGNSIAVNVSATTLYSGSTNVDSLFVKGVSAGSNTTVGGSSQYPVVNIVASPSFNNITASGATSLQTLSATTMISGSTNLYNIFATANSGINTASNGLTKTGNNVTLGGTLTGTTNIVGSTTLSLGTTASRLNTLRSYASNLTELIVGSTATISDYSGLSLDDIGGNYLAGFISSKQSEGLDAIFSLNPTSLKIEFNSTPTPVFLVSSTGETITNNGSNNLLVIDDYINSKGAVYAADYSSNFTPESLVTKRYVDSSATGSTSGSVKSVGATGNLSTGGTATNPTIILASSPSFNSITASGASSFTTLSATTLISGSTNIDSLFVKGVSAGSNTTIGGSAQYPIVNVVANPSFNNITASGATSLQTLSATTMISGSTDLYQIFAPFGQDATTASNGLTKTGNNITLGGTLTGATTINGGTNTFNITGLDITSNNVFGAGDGVTELNIRQGLTYLMDETVGGSVYIGAGPAGNQNRTYINAFDGTLRLQTGVGGGISRFSMFSTGQTVTNNGTNNRFVIVDPASKGLVYNADYKANFTFESLVSKRYVDTSITGITSGMVQSVGATGNLSTGGTATNPTIILAASPSFNGLTVSGTGNFTGTLQSGGTNLYDIFTEGVGTANVLPLWSNNTGLLTNSIITQSGTGVTVAGSVNILGDVNVLGTATTFNTQTVQSQDNNILLNFSGSYVSALGGGITVLSGTPSGVASTWTIDANGSWSSNTAILTSAITVNGGNIAVTGGGAMTSGGTNLYNIFATAGQDFTTASNGLTKTGYNVTLGGTLTAATAVLLGGNALQLSGEGASSATVAWSGAPYYTRLLVNGNGSQLKTTFGTLGDNFFRASDTTTMSFADGGTGSIMRMAFDGTNMYVTDAVNSRGLEYVNDYSPNFLTNSLVTKLYVDQAITGVTSGLTNTHVQPGSNITTGGTAANPTVNLVASPSINNLTVSGTTTAQGISGTTIYASQFFQMTPYTGANPTTPNNNDAWFYSAATGIITLNYRVGGVTKSVELS